VVSLKHVQYRDGCAGDGRGKLFGKEIGPAALAQHLDDLFLPLVKRAAGPAKRFTQCTGNNIDTAHHGRNVRGYSRLSCQEPEECDSSIIAA